jgi:hypothetical protein
MFASHAVRTKTTRAGVPSRKPLAHALARPVHAQEVGDTQAHRSWDFGGIAVVQRKVAVGSVNDPLEAEADRAADQVMHTGTPTLSVNTPAPELRRRCAACEEENAELTLSRKAAGGAPGSARCAAPAVALEAVRSPGAPLEPGVRGFMESRFSHDFGQVRVHADAKATQAAGAVNALAYTVGHDVVFKSGQYAPESERGRHLLAHELAHVVQQEGSASSLQRQAEFESEADTVASDTEAEADTSEVHDGDSPVNASPGTEAAQEGPTLSDVLLAEAAPGPSERAPVESGEAVPTQAGAPQTKDKPKATTPKKDPPAKKTITAIDVDQAAQQMTLTWSDGTKETHKVSTGRGRPNTKDDPCKTQTEKNCTPNGSSFKVGTLGDANTANDHGDKMSWYVEFVPGRSIGIHDSQPVPGVPHSHGCVRVGDTPADDAFAKKVNTHVVPGTTTVNVHGKAPTKPWSKPLDAPKKPKSKKK